MGSVKLGVGKAKCTSAADYCVFQNAKINRNSHSDKQILQMKTEVSFQQLTFSFAPDKLKHGYFIQFPIGEKKKKRNIAIC